jgi:hypothetical protein
MTPQVLAACLMLASHNFQVPPQALIAIMQVEGGHVGQAVGPNQNGSYDLGPMQVNTHWVPQLQRIWHTDYQTTLYRVRDDGCINVHVAAWILRQRINETGNLYRGIAAYHSFTPEHGSKYLTRIIAALRRMGFLTADNRPVVVNQPKG